MPAPRRFDHCQYDPKSLELSATIKTKFEEAESICHQLEEGRAKSLVMTKLEEAFMWAGKAIRDAQIKKNEARQ